MQRILDDCTDDKKKPDEKYVLPKEIQAEFNTYLKNGIYKELHQRKLLSDAQLNSLIDRK